MKIINKVALCVSFATFAILASFADTEVVDGITWTYTVSGGEASLGAPAIPKSTTGPISIPSSLGGKPVTSIGYSAFYGCTNLTSVTIPDSVTNIQDMAFAWCTSLTKVKIPDGVICISYAVFAKCQALTSMTIPDSVTNVTVEAFAGSGIRFVKFGNGLRRLNREVFGGDSYYGSHPEIMVFSGDAPAVPGRSGHEYGSLDDTSGCRIFVRRGSTGWGVDIPGTWKGMHIEYIDEPVFTVQNGVLTDVDLRGTTDVTIPDYVTAIGAGAFSNCIELLSVAIPNSVTNIGENAFWGCISLSEITVPNSVQSIGYAAFSGCSGLKSMTLPFVGARRGSGWSSLNDGYEVLIGYVFGSSPYSGGTVVHSFYPPFDGVVPSSLREVVITDDTGIGESAFMGCTMLTSVKIQDGVTSIGGSAFCGCSGLTSVSIPDGVTRIGGAAFQGCSSLTSVTIPNSVTDLGTWMFTYCSELKSVTIGTGVTYIGEATFHQCGSLTSIYISDLAAWCGIDFDDADIDTPHKLFLNGMEITDLTIPDTVTGIKSDAFRNCTGIKSVTIPASVTNIAWNAFYGCTNVCEATVPGWKCGIPFDNVTNLTISAGTTGISMPGAFCNCRGLKSVTLPDSVIRIGEGAFDGCSGLTSITIPGSVTEIDDDAFAGCSGLMSITIPNSVTYISSRAFRDGGNIGLASIVVEAGNKNYDSRNECNAIIDSRDNVLVVGCQNTIIPNGVTSIGYRAFRGCISLTSVTIPNSVTNISESAVSDTALSKVYVSPGDAERVRQMLAASGYDVSGVTFLEIPTVFDDLPTDVEPDGNGGWMVTITNDIDSADLPIEIPDNLGQVTIDLGGHDIVGGNGTDGDGTTPGGNGMPAIVIVAGDGDGEPTVLTIVTSGGDASVKGGDGGAGNPGGNGAPAVEVEDGARDGVVVNIGAGVIVQGGDGGASDAGSGGDGGAGIVGNVGTNEGTIVGGNGGSSESGDGGNGGAGVDGDVGVNNGDISGGDGGASEGGDAGDSGEGVTGDVGENSGDILPYSLTDEMVGAVANQQFSGVEVKPAPIVYDGVHDKVLEEGVDYVLAWKDNVWPGTATIIVTGKGNYRGEVSRDFAIVSPVELSINAGEYFKATLAELGYDVPTDGVTPYSVVAKGLPAGLKLKYNAAVTKKVKKGKTTKKVVVKPAKVEWWIEGVPTAAVDFFTNPPYLVITVDGVAGVHTLPIEVVAQDVVVLEDLALGQSVNEQFYLPGVTNGWTVSGLPTGLKYTAKRITEKLKSGKQTKTVTKALPYSVYGKTTKAGLFTITAKKKVGGYYETLKYRVLVKPAPVDTALFGEELTNITTMAYVPVEWDLTNDVAAVGGKVAKVTGLPAGLAFASATTYKDKKKTQVKQYGQTIVGTPTKPGTYVVTFTKNVTTVTGKNKKTVAKTAQILWTVTANDANLELGFNTAGGVIEGGTVGLKYGDLMAFSATDGATVTASGMPAGITLANLGGGSYAFAGFTTKAGTYLVTVKATLNGKTVTQRVALKVDGLPSWARGTFNGAVTAPRRDEGIAPYQGDTTNGLATITVSSVGKISGKFQEGGTNWTFTAASYTGYDNAAPAYSVPVVAKYSYKEKEKVKVNGKWTTKTVTKYVTRDFTLKVGQDALGGMAMLEEVDGSTVEAWQNLWGQADYKALGKQLFSTKSGKKTLAYRTFTIKGTDDVGAEMGLTDAMSLSLKVTTAGAVTATMSFDTGTKSKGKAVIYKPTCSTVVIPLSAADNEEFEGEAILFFAPSPANGFPGFAGAAPF